MYENVTCKSAIVTVLHSFVLKKKTSKENAPTTALSPSLHSYYES